jgi:hypothetical protein
VGGWVAGINLIAYIVGKHKSKDIFLKNLKFFFSFFCVVLKTGKSSFGEILRVVQKFIN